MGAEIRIAVVGMACRYPDTKSPAELWRNTLAQRRAFRALPAERLSSGYRGDPDDPDRTYVRRAGLLNGWRFDRARFGIPAGLYRAADLTHWLALETASAALADAGHVDGDGLDRDATGVVIGNSLAGEFGRAAQLRTRWPYVRDAAETALRENGTDESMVLDVLSRMEELVKDPFPVPGDESLAGGLSNTIAGRICNQFDFHGTGFTVDGACSSSLLAVMAACRALAAGELNFALAGGVDLSLDPFELVGFARLGALATDRMRVYDSSPTGFLPGEGCGIVALARAEDAEAQGLHTYGHIVGWGTSSDGSGGLTRPEPTGQALALTRAYRMAQLPPESVALVEGHGTGTAVGDEVELEALATVRGERAQPAALGSIKANIGHTKAAAGAASLVKAVLAVHHGVLPPTTGCESPHDLLRRTPALRVLGEAEPWDEDMRRAAVSSMGFGGINTHVVLESVRSRSSSPRSSLDPVWTRRTPRQVIVVLAADDAATLGDRLEEFAMRAGAYSDAELHDLAATLWYEREGTSPAYRAALVGEHADALVSAAHQARAALSKADPVVVDTAAGYVVGHGRVRVGLLFPGQAAPVRDVLPDWATDLAVPASPEGLRADVTDTSIAQPAIVWQSLVGMSWLERIRCHVVAAAGHSLGELSALAWSGALTADDAVRLAAARGRIMTCHGTPGTTMASLSAGSGEAERFIRSSRVVIAARNGPANTVVSGPADEVAAVVQNAANAGVAAVELPVSHGFHSPAMEGAAEPFRDHLRSVPLNEPRTPVLSTITGIDLTDDDLVELLVRQLTRPVLFEDVLDRMNERCDLLVEVGAGTTLSALATATGAVVVSLDCGGPDRHHALATAALAVAGAADLEAWYAGRPYRRVDLGYRPELLANPCDASAGHAGIAPGRDPRPADAAPAVPSPGGPPAATASSPAAASSPAGPWPDDRPDDPSAGALPDASGGGDVAATGAPQDPLGVLTAELVAVLELPATSITPDSSLLADLHLNSLQATQIVGRAAAALGARMPAAPHSLADATVEQAAALLDTLTSEEPQRGDEPGIPPGVRGWVRAFGHHRVPARTVDEHNGLDWAVRAPAGHWLHAYATPAHAAGDRSGNVALVLDATTDHADIAAHLADLGREPLRRLLLVDAGCAAAAAVGRSVAVEREPEWVRVVRLDSPDLTFDPGYIAEATAEPYAELHLDGDGTVERTVLRHEPLGGNREPALEPGDVCLVTGGIRGITAYTATALARRTGCTLVILGRTDAGDPSISAALEELRYEIDVHYVSCDVTVPASVGVALAEARRLGPVRGLLHGAGVNEPRRLSDIGPGTLWRTMAPKTDGLAAVLGAAGDELRLVLAFGSIIGCAGLPGQAEYCVANDSMRRRVESWAAEHPECRSHVLEWSVWSGIGMGVELGVVDTLRDMGVAPMGPEEARDALLDVLATDDAPVTLLVTGRFPNLPTLAFDRSATRLLRFDEDRRGRVPGVEAVSEATLTAASDPYLEDHRIGGVVVLPAVLSLEALSQLATSAVAELGTAESWSLADVDLRQPITVDGPTTIRTAVLSTGDAVDAVIRTEHDDFSSDAVTARVVPAPPRPARAAARAVPPMSGEHPFYGSVLFHEGRFRRVQHYDLLTAFRVEAWITAEDGQEWFSPLHSSDLLFGDPGAHDASLHVLLACVPHRLALPVGAGRFTVWRRPDGPLQVVATEIAHTGDTYDFTVDVREPDGSAVARWDGLQLRAVEPRRLPSRLPVPLVGPWLSRRLTEIGIAADVEVTACSGDRAAGSAAEVASLLCGVPVGHDLRGALMTTTDRNGDEAHVCGSYTGDFVLVGRCSHAVGVDWQRSDPAVPMQGTELEPGDRASAAALRAAAGETEAESVLRMWSVREALVKLGHSQDLALDVRTVTDDGIVVADVGPVEIVSVRLAVGELGDTTIALAVTAKG